MERRSRVNLDRYETSDDTTCEHLRRAQKPTSSQFSQELTINATSWAKDNKKLLTLRIWADFYIIYIQRLLVFSFSIHLFLPRDSYAKRGLGDRNSVRLSNACFVKTEQTFRQYFNTT